MRSVQVNRVLFLIVLIGSFMLSAKVLNAQGLNTNSVAQLHRPVQIYSHDWADFIGKPLQNVHVLAMQPQGLSQIFSQWTQLTDEGTLFTKAYKNIPFSGNLDLLDEWDRLEFMYADAGVKPCKSALEAVGVTSELLELQISPRGVQPSQIRFVCLLVGPLPKAVTPLPGSFGYVNYDAKTSRATSEYYHLALSNENPLIWTDFYYAGVNLNQITGLPEGPSILDSLKIIIQVNIFGKPSPLRLDNSHLHTTILDVQHGPLYDSMFGITRVKLAGVTMLTMQTMMHFYPQHVEMKTRFKIPSTARALLSKPQVDVSLDANNMLGSKVLTSWGPAEPVVVDGRMDQNEIDLTQQKVNSKDAWVWFSTQRGFDLFTFIEFDQDFAVPIALVYDDDKDKEVLPERFKGQGPNIGYSIRGLIFGRFFTFNTQLIFSSTVARNRVESTVEALRKPWSIVTTAKSPLTTPALISNPAQTAVKVESQ